MNKKRPPARYLVEYIGPGQRRPRNLTVGPRQLEMLNLLRREPASRMDMLERGRPRIALNATSTVTALRNKGVAIHSEWLTATDGAHYPVRYVQYQLQGRLVSMQPVQRKH